MSVSLPVRLFGVTLVGSAVVALAAAHPLATWRRPAWLICALLGAGLIWSHFAKLDEVAIAPAEVVHRLFHEEHPQRLGEKRLRFGCSCSQERVEGMLVSLGEVEARAAVEAGQGAASIHCEFCGREYRFNGDEVGFLFRDAGIELPAARGIQ